MIIIVAIDCHKYGTLIHCSASQPKNDRPKLPSQQVAYLFPTLIDSNLENYSGIAIIELICLQLFGQSF